MRPTEFISANDLGRVIGRLDDALDIIHDPKRVGHDVYVALSKPLAEAKGLLSAYRDMINWANEREAKG